MTVHICNSPAGLFFFYVNLKMKIFYFLMENEYTSIR